MSSQKSDHNGENLEDDTEEDIDIDDIDAFEGQRVQKGLTGSDKKTDE